MSPSVVDLAAASSGAILHCKDKPVAFFCPINAVFRSLHGDCTSRVWSLTPQGGSVFDFFMKPFLIDLCAAIRGSVTLLLPPGDHMQRSHSTGLRRLIPLLDCWLSGSVHVAAQLRQCDERL